MSTGQKKKKKKRTRQQELQRKRSIRNLLWILAGCIILGGGIGFFAGRYWLYPNYEESKGVSATTDDTQNQSEKNNQELQDLNRQLDQSDSGDDSELNPGE